MKFALQDSLLGYGGDYKTAFHAARELGFDGVELTYTGRMLDDSVTAAVIAASQAAAIPVSAVCGGYAHWIGHFDKEKRLQAVADIKQSLRQIGKMEGGGLIAPAAYGMFSTKLPPYTAPRSVAEDDEALLDSLSRIAEAAETNGAALYLEPLNRYEDHMVNNAKKALYLIEKTGSGNIRVMVDTYHMNIEERDPLRTVEDHHSDIGYYHLSDSNRHQPGAGHIDFGSLLKLLQKKGYDGYLSLECRIDGKRKESLEQSLRHLRGFLSG